MADRIPLPTNLKAVFLDAGGVLIAPDVLGVCQRIEVESELNEVLDAYAFANDRQDQPEGTDNFRHAWIWEKCFEKLGLDSTPLMQSLADSIRNGTYHPWFPVTPAPGVHEALADLAEITDNVVVVSNANGTIEREMEAAGVCQVGAGEGFAMKAVLDSTTVGFDKPGPEIFKRALSEVGVSVDETVHVGDSLYSDMEGARKVGIAGIHINRMRDCIDQSHYHAYDLGEAVRLLKDSSK